MKLAFATRGRWFTGFAGILVVAAVLLYFHFRNHKVSGQSISDIEQQVNDHPNDSGLKLKLGSALHSQHRDVEAIETFKNAASLDPLDTRALNSLAQIAISQKRDDDALRYLQNSLKIKQDDPAIWRSYGLLLEKQHPKAAWQALCEAVTLDNSKSGELLRSGVLALEHQQIRRGLHDMQGAAALNPDDLMTEVQLGAAARASDAPTIAAQAYNKALSISPDCVPALVGSAASTLQVDPTPTGFARASKQLDYVIGLAPSSDAYITRGHLNLMERHYDAAVSDLKTALKMDTRLATAHTLLYQCYAALGKQELAHTELTTYIANSPDAKAKRSAGTGMEP